MAHVTVEWTDNLVNDFEIRPLLELIAQDMRDNADNIFPVGGIRVRGIKLHDYVIADGTDPRDAFINIDVKMGVGRSSAFRKSYFDRLNARIIQHLGDLFERRPLAYTLYVAEVDGWKHNSIHKRLKNS